MGGYQVNNYRNNWHTRDKNCCEGCNTANNPINYDPRVQSAHAAAVQLTQFFTGLVSTGIDYAATKQASKTEKTVEVPESTTPDRGRSADVEEAEVVQEDVKVETSVEKENKVKNIIGAEKFNGLSAEIKADVLKKYDTIKAYAQQNNIEVSDAEMARRLTSYTKALAAKEKEVEMTQGFLNGETQIPSIVDEDIKQQKATGTDEQYFQSILNRGTGVVQLFDKNGDNQVTESEYLQGQEQEYKNMTGENLSLEMVDATKKMFNKLNKDTTADSSGNQFLSEAEFATHEFAVATLGDKDKNTTEELTIEEYMASGEILTNAETEKNYDYGSNKIWEVMKKFK